ncbi:glycoside hydrolase family 43 protein [Paenibacillus sp. D2_2]|uniref:glycoside hydrolase family 43 protein n=1 Tax=Paenibacillus sp. D2_2 TaxID=3073092 RepID=UPI0028168879|nr:glycoside hydrolase family 43 protein [Paenibacillus sp. D2_2]WMT40088.1 glycoside hydrolase family 43 protein [Paenibacillus sp. D2_2]
MNRDMMKQDAIQPGSLPYQDAQEKLLQLGDIHIRDPFVYADKDAGFYYMYGTMGVTSWGGAAIGFDGYRSRDLHRWEGPFPVFRKPEGFWADHHFWAPEVHYYEGGYYMFASFKAEGKCRGTQILKADAPLGPFVPMGEGPVTPADWECLDGTLYTDEHGDPWMIFCHEWTQVGNGEMCAMRLAADLSGPASDPLVLFRATDAHWPVEEEGPSNFVTDGPFLYLAPDGKLLMIWSSHGKDGYAIGIARSESGSITGPWVQEREQLFEKNGGHGMLFRTFEGELLVSLHLPNTHPYERPAFFKAGYQAGRLMLLF